MPDTITTLRPRGAVGRPARARPPFNARPVSAAGRESRSQEGPYSTHYTAVASFLYINRLSGQDRFGKVPDSYVDRGDLLAAGRCHPLKIPPQLREGETLWREADEAAAREGPRAVSATHIVADLPPADDADRWTWLIESYCFRHLVERGMIADWSIHCRKNADGVWAGTPHVHILVTSRFWRPNNRRGTRQWQWLANAEQTRAARDAWLQHIGGRPAAA